MGQSLARPREYRGQLRHELNRGLEKALIEDQSGMAQEGVSNMVRTRVAALKVIEGPPVCSLSPQFLA